ncbi:cupin domain-containing protein [Marinobacterium lutimaris]|uniref:Transcriptional regulator, XRE family with cupin sensor n=1 Tax=Marinobacterium lutimaris TaxID=568106 RepID=A0A1H6DR08_9GAMM|nr:cupin domain-containing protein [Marinobacterium lutimaris]SEG87035.1 transcriptional regulator, XRE family with cupin sensor [Marinobacterium lutimaris]
MKNDNYHAPSAEPSNAASNTDADVALGGAIRSARIERGLSLSAVASNTGISVGLLSQIERGISSPSVRVLRGICKELNVPLDYLIEASDSSRDETGRIIRKVDRRVVNFGSKKMVKEFLTTSDTSELQLMEISLEPGGGSGEQPYTHEGEECGVVLEGRLELYVDGDRYLLSEGDSFQFQSTLPHKFQNLADTPTRILWVTTPAVW